MNDAQFQQAALAAGFTQKQADFLKLHVARQPHTHDADQVFVGGDNSLNLDNWSDSVEERLDELESDEPEEEETEDAEETEDGV